MAWEIVAASAVPIIANMLLPHEKAPKYQAAPPPPDRSKYINQILDAGFNQDSGLYNRAAEMLQEQINRMISSQGLTGSSIGGQLMINSQADLANKFVNDSLNRMSTALSPVLQYDSGVFNRNQGALDAAYNAAMADYNRSVGNNQSIVSGLGSLANAGLMYYGQNQAIEAAREAAAANQDRIMTMMNDWRNPAPSYGVPGPGYNLQPYTPPGY